jgi:hypothetical protein
VLTLAHRFPQLAPLTRIDVERVTFDTAVLQHPELSGVEDQRGARWGREIRAYVLHKFGRRCAYCKGTTGPFELDHVLRRSRGGSDRVSHLALACRPCNQANADRTAAEWGHPEVEAQAKARLRDAAAVNATRSALCNALQALGLPLTTWCSGPMAMPVHCMGAASAVLPSWHDDRGYRAQRSVHWGLAGIYACSVLSPS